MKSRKPYRSFMIAWGAMISLALAIVARVDGTRVC